MNRFRTRDEDGAVLIIVVLTIFALLAMTVLVIDVGGLLVTRRRAVRGADAAALAAAQSCAIGDGLGEAQAQADIYAEDNQATTKQGSTTGDIVEEEGCAGSASNGFVRVKYDVPQDFYFAQVLGLPDGQTVPAGAKAIWGPIGTAEATPLMVAAGAFNSSYNEDCEIPTPAAVGAPCAFWYESGTIGSSTFGWLNLFGEDEGNKWGWNVPSDHQCRNSSADERRDWINTSPQSSSALNWPEPTYVCSDTGVVDANWSDLEDQVGEIKTFPVTDADGSWSAANGGTGAHGQVDNDGSPTASDPDKYDVIGFISLRIVAVFDGDDPEVQGTPGTTTYTNVQCVHSERFVGGQVLSLDVDTSSNGCPADAGVIPDSINEGTPFVWTGNQNNKQPVAQCGLPIVPPCYEYDDINRTITWSGATTNNVRVDFTWSRAGSPALPGVCGEHFDGKQQDKCMLTEWVGFTSDVGDPGTGADFGIRGVRLSQ
jgi:hypothetical protein